MLKCEEVIFVMSLFTRFIESTPLDIWKDGIPPLLLSMMAYHGPFQPSAVHNMYSSCVRQGVNYFELKYRGFMDLLLLLERDHGVTWQESRLHHWEMERVNQLRVR